MLLESDIMVQILAGGKGFNLLKETNGQIPKSLVKVTDDQTIIDIVVEEVKKKRFNHIVYSLGLSDGCFGIEIYKHLLQKGHGVECVFEQHNDGNARSIQRLAELTACKYPIFVICSDMLLPWDALKNVVSSHKQGSFTWLTSSNFTEEMSRYHGLKIRNDGAVVYDTKLTPEGKFLDDGNLTTVTKGGAILIDPLLLLDTMNQLSQTTDTNKELDIFWDVIPFLERINLNRLKDGKQSLINAVVGKDPVMDMGTPERLSTVRKYLKHE